MTTGTESIELKTKLSLVLKMYSKNNDSDMVIIPLSLLRELGKELQIDEWNLSLLRKIFGNEQKGE